MRLILVVLAIALFSTQVRSDDCKCPCEEVYDPLGYDVPLPCDETLLCPESTEQEPHKGECFCLGKHHSLVVTTELKTDPAYGPGKKTHWGTCFVDSTRYFCHIKNSDLSRPCGWAMFEWVWMLKKEGFK
jgi:hypothetical protein